MGSRIGRMLQKSMKRQFPRDVRQCQKILLWSGSGKIRFRSRKANRDLFKAFCAVPGYPGRNS
eukprot:3047678-Rhodomonas_salina.1